MTCKVMVLGVLLLGAGFCETARALVWVDEVKNETREIECEAQTLERQWYVARQAAAATALQKNGAQSLAALMIRFNGQYSDLVAAFATIQEQERAWLKAVVDQANADKPNFVLVWDRESYQRELGKVVRFERGRPPEIMADEESELLRKASEIKALANTIRALSLSLAGGNAMAIVAVHVNVSAALAQLKKIEASVREAEFVVDQMVTAVRQQRQARQRSVVAVAEAWRRGLRLAMGSVLTHEAEEIADAAERAVRGTAMYLEASALAAAAAGSASVMFNLNQAPLHARRIAVADGQRLRDALERVDALSIASADRDAIRDVLQKAKASLQRDQAIMAGAALDSKRPRYMKSRNDFASRLLGRTTITSACRELGQALIAELDAFAHEEKFIRLKKTCL